jgi:hypothetical protein
MKKEKNKATEVIQVGSEIAGSMATSVALSFIAGPSGAYVGAALGPLIVRLFNNSLSDTYDAFTGKAGLIRAGSSAVHAIIEIEKKLKNGQALREDGFFETNVNHSKAKEIFEGVLIKSRDAYEEKKIKYIANIFVRGAFDDSYSAEELHYMLKLAENLTYEQFLLLRMYYDKSDFSLSPYSYKGSVIGPMKFALVEQVLSLYREGLIVLRDDPSNQGPPVSGMSDFDNFTPGFAGISEFGKRLVCALNLRQIKIEEINEIVKSFGHRG